MLQAVIRQLQRSVIMSKNELYTLGIDIGSTTVKIAILDKDNDVAFSDYERHYANIQETLSDLLGRAIYKLGGIYAYQVITGSGGQSINWGGFTPLLSSRVPAD